MYGRQEIIKSLNSGNASLDEFNFDMMRSPPIEAFIPYQLVDYIRTTASSLKLSSRPDKKVKAIDNILSQTSLRRLGSGTNRLVYKSLDDDRYVLKIALDNTGKEANILEFKNQNLLKPFVAKTFWVDNTGIITISERVDPILRCEDFMNISDIIFPLITNLIGKYVIEDIGANFYMNWGIRKYFGPVLLDYPYVYEIDGDKLYCDSKDKITEAPCPGLIDYDTGFNYLVCNKCNKRFYAKNLAKNKEEISINFKGDIEPMKVKLVRGNETVYENSVMESTSITARSIPQKPKIVFSTTKSRLVRDNEIVYGEKQQIQKEEPKEEISKGFYATVETQEPEEEIDEDIVFEEDDDSDNEDPCEESYEEEEPEQEEEQVEVKNQSSSHSINIPKNIENICDEIDYKLSNGTYTYNDQGKIVDKQGRTIKVPKEYFLRDNED